MAEPVSRILHGMNALRRDNPWPEFPYGEIEPFYLPLDGGRRAGVEVGGGRQLIIDAIKQYKVALMVEVGCFLCGSTLQWLRANDKLTIIGVDPWESNWAAYIERMAVDPLMSRTVFHLTEAKVTEIVANLRRHGNFCIALNNVRLYKQRFIPVRRSIPEAFNYLSERQIKPDMIYIDAGKHREDIDTAFRLFPQSILCGDDWLWPDETGQMRMQIHVKAFAADNNFEIRHQGQSWLLIPPQQKPVRDKPAAGADAKPAAPAPDTSSST